MLMSLFDKPLNSINSYLSMVPMHFHTIAIERIWLFYWKATDQFLDFHNLYL